MRSAERGLDLSRDSWIRLAGPRSLERAPGGSAAQPPERPGRMPAHERLGITERRRERRHRVRIAAVAEGDRHVAEKPAALGPRHGGPAETRPEAGGVEGEERGEAGRERLGRTRLRCGLIPRTGHLAEVTAEDPVGEVGAQLVWDRAPVLYRQIGDAAPGVHRIRLQRAGRTGGEAASAGAAVVRGQRDSVEREVGQELGEEEVRAGRAVEEERVLADPAETGARRPFPLEHRPRVDVRAEAGGGKDVAEPLDQPLEQRAYPVLIVHAEGVRGDASAQLGPPVARWHGRGAIRIGERHDAARPGKRRARVYALCRAPREVAHLTRAAVREPALEKRPPLEGAERRRAGPREPEQTRLARDALRGGGHCHTV